MTSTFHGIETSKRGLMTQTTALNTTGHNISNANTAGYTRQVVNMSASSPMEAYGLSRSTSTGQIGTGVEATSIKRIRDTFLDSQYRSENSALGSWDIQYSNLDKIQTIMNEPSDTGLQTVLDNFWNAWSDFSNDPNNTTNRNIIKQTTLALTDSLNNISTKLSQLDTDLSSSVTLKATEANGYLSQIAELNGSIKKIEGLGDDANDLRDKRDYYVDQLSKLGNVSITEQADGYEVTFGGQVLVTGQTVNSEVSLQTLQDAYNGGTLSSGEFNGLFKSKAYVTDYQTQMNQLANTIANGDVEVTIPSGSVLPEGTVLNGVTYSDANGNRTLSSDLTVTVQGINGLHKLGYNLSGQAGGNIFVASDGGTLTAANITLSTDIQNDSSLIASSMRLSGGTVVSGNNSLALLMENLKYAKFSVSSTNSTTINDYLSATMGQLGVQTEDAQRELENSQTLVDQVDSSRQSVSGVSLDEEMSNLIKFQQAYSASARFMTTYDEILDKLINGTAV
ncbi:flagellar hook-associated protein FlgK [Paenibacillus pinistramenti]|uniref:flagellar hook-associated protein FlgK n=1 Tax=Paenibacillus pinistramenti TaxID=1768003 RepID=UPI001109CB28|nr:flagellar hook-associated protein FlgK [Paenibacillus pinistramenti]